MRNPWAANHSQWDADWDGYGNRCDGDYNNNGIVDIADITVCAASFGCFTSECAHMDRNGNGLTVLVDIADITQTASELHQLPGPSCIDTTGCF